MVKLERVSRINSLLKEVLFEVIQKEVRNPHITTFITVTRVEASKDLHHAKVYVSMIADPKVKEAHVAALQSAAGFIAVHASKKVQLRYFPDLTFHLDTSIDKLMKVQEILDKIEKERNSRAEDGHPTSPQE